MTTEGLWTVRETADFLGVSRAQLYRWMDDGELPFIRLTSRLRRLDPNAVRAWVQAREENAPGDRAVGGQS